MASAKQFFNEQEQNLVVEAIRNAEIVTSGEIRVHIESWCLGNPIKRAEAVFLKLGLQQTRERNGILIYIATRSHKLAVVGDQGIHQKVGDAYWQKLVNTIIEKFKADKKAEALAEAIIECGLQLGKFFPRHADDTNELDDSISY